MKVFKFLNQARTDVMKGACHAGVETPLGSYAREVVGIGSVGDLVKLNDAELDQIGTVKAVLASYDAAAVIITARDWDRHGDGSVKIVDQSVTEVITTQPIDPAIIAAREAQVLVTAKEAALMAVSMDICAARRPFLPCGAGDVDIQMVGQEHTNIDKESEARRWVAQIAAGETPAAADYPYLKACAERINPSMPDYQGVANAWNIGYDKWQAVNVELESVRVGVLSTVSTAADIAAVNVARDDALAACAAIVAAHQT